MKTAANRRAKARPGRMRKADRPPHAEPDGGLLAEVSAAVRLAEGAEGVRRVLRVVFLEGPVPIRDLARQAQLPVPVVAAVRGELERRGLLEREGGVVFSEAGLAAVREAAGFACVRRFPRPEYPRLPEDLAPVVDRMRAICAGRPEADVTLDQSHATPETALRRALFLYANDALEGRDVLVLGDDDLTSAAIQLVAEALGIRVGRLTVLEYDARLVAYVSERVPGAEVIQHDLRQVLPGDLSGRFDVFFTDPPYTTAGFSLFVSRGADALRPEVGKQGYVSFGHRMPREMAEAVGALVDMGMPPVEIIPEFNRYVGAQMLAGVSQMIRTVSAGRPSPKVVGVYDGPLYTADRRRKGRGRG